MARVNREAPALWLSGSLALWLSGSAAVDVGPWPGRGGGGIKKTPTIWHIGSRVPTLRTVQPTVLSNGRNPLTRNDGRSDDG